MEEEGVLLYYKFAAIPDTQALSLWFRSLCSSLGLVGRIRVAPDGVNVTVGGAVTSLHKHITAVKSHSWLGECDFKLAAAHTTRIGKSVIAPEVGFSSLSVRIVKELVTLGVHPSCCSVSDAGTHLSALEFHTKIQEVEHTHNFCLQGTNHSEQFISNGLIRQQDSNDVSRPKAEENKDLVLLDVRNIYETRIGKFVPPRGVGFLDPQIRQYSDLPGWLDANAEKLQNKNILMYCTGGVRCEMASAYLKKKGKGFENVFQLSGGIQRYLEAFPDGGYFKGKNFVFDHRIAVSSTCPEVLGVCSNCGMSFDDYSSRIRCSNCRLLLLFCGDCQATISSSEQHQLPMCELCKASRAANNHHNVSSKSNDIDELCSGEGAAPMESSEERGLSYPSADNGTSQALYGPFVRRRLRILCLHGFRQSASSLKGRLASFTKKLKSLADLVFVDAPHKVPLVFSKGQVLEDSKKLTQFRPDSGVPHRKYAWLVTPEMMAACSNAQASSSALISDAIPTLRTAIDFDKDQYKRQTLGWSTSLRMLERVFSEMGPFDGVLGFSQGAAVAAALCVVSESNIQASDSIKFGFVMLCSGFVCPASELQDLMPDTQLPLKCPSLHMFAESAERDRQIVNEESKQLASMFDPENSVVLTHNLGHIVPSHKENMDKIKGFLNHFV